MNKANWTKVIVLNDILLNYAYYHSIWHQLSITRNQKLNDKLKIQNNTNKTGNLVIDFNQIYTTKSINEIAEMLNLWTQNNILIEMSTWKTMHAFNQNKLFDNK